jgi:hypothetical protein
MSKTAIILSQNVPKFELLKYNDELLNIYIKQRLLRTYLLRYLVIRAAMGTGKG